MKKGSGPPPLGKAQVLLKGSGPPPPQWLRSSSSVKAQVLLPKKGSGPPQNLSYSPLTKYDSAKYLVRTDDTK